MFPVLVVVTFMFPDENRAHVFDHLCRTQQCVDRFVQDAERDPAVVRYQVLIPGDDRVQTSGVAAFQPSIDRWKQ